MNAVGFPYAFLLSCNTHKLPLPLLVGSPRMDHLLKLLVHSTTHADEAAHPHHDQGMLSTCRLGILLPPQSLVLAVSYRIGFF